MANNIVELVNKNPISPMKIHEEIASMNIVDIADAFNEIYDEKTVPFFRILPKDIAADVFAYIDPDKQQLIVEGLPDAEAGKIIEELFVDDAVDFIEEMPANVVKRVLRTVSEDKRQLINQLLQYPEDSAGSIMNTDYVDLKEDMTVSDAFNYIRRIGVSKETIYTCYVIRRDRVLTGVVTVKKLLLADQSNRIGDIMEANLIFAQTMDDQEEIAALFNKYSLISLPVVDKEQRLVGIVTADDIIQVIQEEATEDFEIMAALNPSETPYLKTGVLKQSSNRIPWLMFLMLSATISGMILDNFQESLIPILVFFIPMLMDTAGNAGNQASALIIRGLALGEITPKKVIIVLWRELRVGLICGLALGSANFLRIYLMHGRDYLLCLTVTLSLMVTVVMSKTVGCTLPLLAKKIKIDPAIMAAPLVTTIVDAAALIVYFYIAKAIMNV